MGCKGKTLKLLQSLLGIGKINNDLPIKIYHNFDVNIMLSSQELNYVLILFGTFVDL